MSVLLQEVDESGAEVLTVLLPCGTPLPARIQRLLSGDGRLSSLRMDLYQRGGAEEPQQLARVGASRHLYRGALQGPVQIWLGSWHRNHPSQYLGRGSGPDEALH